MLSFNCLFLNSSHTLSQHIGTFYFKSLLVCPDGFELFDKKRCVKLVTDEKDKSSADSDCSTHGGNILTSKTLYSKYQVERFLRDKDPIENLYLGMSKSDEQWIWDDTKTTVFAERINSNN